MRMGLLLLQALLPFSSIWAQLPAASFHHLRRDERLMSSFYHCLAEDEYGFIWFGSRHGGGLYRYDGYDLKSFVVDPSKLHVSLASNEINNVFSYGDGLLYIATHGGMTILNLVSGKMQCYADDIAKVPDYSVFLIQPIIPDSNRGCIWIGSAYGLCQLKWATDSIVCFVPARSQMKGPMPRNIIDMIVDKGDEHILWIGTTNGLFRYDKDKGDYEHHDIPYAKDMVILDLFEDSASNIWIAGDAGIEKHEAKLFRYTPQTNSFHEYKLAFTGSDYDPGVGEVYYILPAMDEDKLWISTKTSVGLLNKNTGAYNAWTFDPNRPDGLLPNEFFRSMLADRHGRLWISSWQGIQYAKNAFAGEAKLLFKPKVAITDVKVSNARADMPKPLLYKEAIHLQRDQRDITIRYVLPNPLNAFMVTYQYQLEGWDKDWISSDQRLVQYSRLKGGRYTFHVRGKEGHGEWSEISSLPIRIEHRITEYPWFWMLMVTLLGAMIIGTNRYLISRTRKDEQLKSDFNKKVSEIEMQALRAQMNPHFLFNSLNSIKYYALSKDKDATADYLTKFSLLVRTILNNSKSHTISVKEEIDALRLYIEIEHLRLEGKFEYQIDVDSSIRVEQAQMPPMILQPFVENAIWHGLMHKPSGGKLLVQVRDMGTQIQCIIEDNGIGRARAREIMNNGSGHKKSMGMRITGDRIALINRIYGIDTQVHIIDLVNAGGVAEGTRVVINIPLINEFE
jgi:ligand-binding sensor domain-containing protein